MSKVNNKQHIFDHVVYLCHVLQEYQLMTAPLRRTSVAGVWIRLQTLTSPELRDPLAAGPLVLPEITHLEQVCVIM